MSTGVTNLPGTDPIIDHLEDQISWYDKKSLTNQRIFKRMKVIEIGAAATIPFLAASKFSEVGRVTGGLGY